MSSVVFEDVRNTRHCCHVVNLANHETAVSSSALLQSQLSRLLSNAIAGTLMPHVTVTWRLRRFKLDKFSNRHALLQVSRRSVFMALHEVEHTYLLSPVSCDSLVLQGLRCEWGAGVLNLVLSLSLSHTGHWKFNMAPHGKELSEDLKKRMVALHKDGVGYKKIAKTLKLSCSTLAKTIQRFNRTGSTQNRPRHGRPVHVLSVISRDCVWEIDI